MAFDSSKSFDFLPIDESDKTRMAEISETAKRLAQMMMINVPESRERAFAFAYLEMAMAWANKAITHN